MLCCVPLAEVPQNGRVGTRAAASFDLSKQNNVVAYWGQGDNGDPPLSDVCNSNSYDVIVLSFITTIGQYKTPRLDSDSFSADDVNHCHSKGKTMMISIGGGGTNVRFDSTDDAQNAAGQVWNLFLGGKSNNRPFGNVIFDGIDLDIESGPPSYWANFTTALLAHYKSDPTHTYYLSSAPQCPYSDAQMGPDGTVWDGTPISGSAITYGWFDFLNLQFYNNPGCQVPDKGFNILTWSNALRQRTTNKDMKILVGLPGSPSAADSGYVDPYSIPVAKLKSFSNFAGIMFWDVQAAQSNNNFQDKIKEVLNN
jgi:chitinase